MIDHILAREAFRQRLLGTTVATTGSTTLSATSTGYARPSGSFVTDGFAVGMEVSGTGFSAPNNLPGVIEGVTAGFLTIAGGRAVQSATAGRTLVVGIPSLRIWENTQPIMPAPGTRPYISEQWIPATTELFEAPVNGGSVEEQGLYTPTIFGLGDQGILAIRRYAEAIKARFAPGTRMSAGGNFISVRVVPGPVARQIIPLDNGMAYSQIVIPWRAATPNIIAA